MSNAMPVQESPSLDIRVLRARLDGEAVTPSDETWDAGSESLRKAPATTPARWDRSATPCC